jgi:hypothetical protein
MSHIRCMYHPKKEHTFTPVVGDGLTCLTFGACTTKEHIYTQKARLGTTSRMVGDGLTCLTFVMYPRNTFTPRWARMRTVQDSWGWSHMSHIRCMYLPGTHLHQRWARIVETVQDSWGWSHVSHSVYKEHIYTPRWARIEDSPGWLGMVSHVSHSLHATQEHIYTKVGQGLRTVQDSWGWSHMSHIRCMYHPRNTFTPKVGQDS